MRWSERGNQNRSSVRMGIVQRHRVNCRGMPRYGRPLDLSADLSGKRALNDHDGRRA